jgi:hypothetical protein
MSLSLHPTPYTLNPGANVNRRSAGELRAIQHWDVRRLRIYVAGFPLLLAQSLSHPNSVACALHVSLAW